MSELFNELKADDQSKGFLLSRIGRSLNDERKLGRVVEMSPEYSDSYSLVSLLFQLRQKNPGQADLLFRSALQRAASRNDLMGGNVLAGGLCDSRNKLAKSLPGG
jgi:hypothetical protein